MPNSFGAYSPPPLTLPNNFPLNALNPPTLPVIATASLQTFSQINTLFTLSHIPTVCPLTLEVCRHCSYPWKTLLIPSNPDNTPGKQTGTATPPSAGFPKLGKPKTEDPIIPVSGTLFTCHFPPKLNLEVGHITGSQTLNNTLQSLILITSVQRNSVAVCTALALAWLQIKLPIL